jgi:hypothetical protein
MVTPTSTAPSNQPVSEDTLAMLACLRTAVAEALERKRKLGQYRVEWSAEGPKLVGPDAPAENL